MKLTRFFAPGTNSPMGNLGLLVLRAWLGIAILMNHGLDKVEHFNEMAGKFPDLLHLGSSTASLALSVLAEAGCAALLVVGLLTRLAALGLVINLSVAFVLVHKLALKGEHSGELAFIYLAGFVALLIAGPGRYSADGTFFNKA